MTDFWLRWLSAAADASIVALAALIVVRCAGRLPAAWRAGLLAVAVLKLLVPPLVVRPLDPPSVARLDPIGGVPGMLGWLLLVHAAGVVVFAAWVIADRIRMGRLIRRTSTDRVEQPLMARYAQLAARMGMRRLPGLLVAEHDVGPLACGLIRPAVVLPRRLVDELEPDQLDAVLAHELMHHRRRDIRWLALASAAVCLWWFNPVAHLLARTLRRTLEEASDAGAMATAGLTPARYSSALIRSARWACDAPPPALGVHPLGARLARLAGPGRTGTGLLSPSASAALILLGLVLVPASGRPAIDLRGDGGGGTISRVVVADTVRRAPVPRRRAIP